MSGPQLVVHTTRSLALDECLVIVVTLEAGTERARVSARLNLIEGDVAITVAGAAGHTTRCVWPWPVDAMPRWVDLPPGSRLAGAVPLVATETSAPLFPVAGEYTLTAKFDAAAGVALSSAPVSIRRTAPDSTERAAALADRDVLQSLLSGSVLGAAAHGLTVLSTGGTMTTRVLAALALDQLDDVLASVDRGDDESVTDIVQAVSAILPGGFSDADPRRTAVERLLEPQGKEQALFQATPF